MTLKGKKELEWDMVCPQAWVDEEQSLASGSVHVQLPLIPTCSYGSM